MLNTVTGMRYPEDAEHMMIAFGGNRLGNHILTKIRCEEKKIEHEGVTLKAIKEDSAFHGLGPQSQLILLHHTLTLFFGQIVQNNMTQFANAALESVYSCLFHEVKCEIEQSKSIRNGARSCVYYAWEYWFDGQGTPLTLKSTDLNEWVGAIDKLAARTVYDYKFAKQFEVGYMPDISDIVLNSAQTYLENLV